jgi:hypothetical protein
MSKKIQAPRMHVNVSGRWELVETAHYNNLGELMSVKTFPIAEGEKLFEYDAGEIEAFRMEFDG